LLPSWSDNYPTWSDRLSLIGEGHVPTRGIQSLSLLAQNLRADPVCIEVFVNRIIALTTRHNGKTDENWNEFVLGGAKIQASANCKRNPTRRLSPVRNDDERRHKPLLSL